MQVWAQPMHTRTLSAIIDGCTQHHHVGTSNVVGRSASIISGIKQTDLEGKFEEYDIRNNTINKARFISDSCIRSTFTDKRLVVACARFCSAMINTWFS